MVRVFYNRGFESYSLEEFRKMSALDLILAVTKQDMKNNITQLTRMGRKIPLYSHLSEIEIGENDCFRIVEQETPDTVIVQREDVTKLIAECKVISKTMHSSPGGRTMKTLVALASAEDFIEKVAKAVPSIVHSHDVISFLSDPVQIYMATQFADECKYLSSKYPIFVKALHFVLRETTKHRRNSPNLDNVVPQASGNVPRAAAAAGPSISGQDITADMLQQAINFAMGRPNASSAPAPSRAPVVQADPLAQLRTRYSAQLVQLNDFGFTEDVQNLSVLESVGGNVQLALELLLSIREEGI